MDAINWKAVGFTLLPFTGGFVGSRMTRGKIETFYKDLRKPAYRPPNWAFPVVWTSLYTCMGYASYMVYRDGGGFEGSARTALALYGGQLLVNWSFTPIFFGMEKLFWGFVNTAVLWGGVAVTMKSFYDINPNAGALLIPYQIWVTLAATLAYNIWKMNPDHKKKDA